MLTKTLLEPANSPFPIELIKAFSQLSLCSAQNLDFHFCLCQRSFHSIFFGKFIHVPFLRTVINLAYFRPCFFCYVFIYLAVENRCTLKQHNIVLSLFNRFLYVILLLLFKKITSYEPLVYKFSDFFKII